MSIRVTAANLAWMATCYRDWKHYKNALKEPVAAQAQVLAEIVPLMQETPVMPVRFEDLAPRNWSEFSPLVQRAAEGEPGLFGRLEINRFVPTSGSDVGTKLVPYNNLLGRQFQRAIRAWVYELYRNQPSLMTGHAYWSISPAIAEQETSSGIPVGFEQDSAYLGGLLQKVVNQTLAVPGIIRETTPQEFQRSTLLFLLAQPDLRLISVWSPSFLIQLVDYFNQHREELARDLFHGIDVHGWKLKRELTGQPWPGLELISCWTDGHAKNYLPALQRHFPDTTIQAKGLVATEAFVSLPFAGARPLAITSHYLEFEFPDGRLKHVRELKEGDEAVVVVSTGGGLLRYRLGDQVAVKGFLHKTPCIEFLGRKGRISDRHGEKLDDAFVGRVLDELGVRGFSMLAPDGEGYTLFAEHPPGREQLEQALGKNIHYRWAVSNGQLRSVRICRVGSDASNAYQARCAERGQRLGDIKPTALDLYSDWHEVFSR